MSKSPNHEERALAAIRFDPLQEAIHITGRENGRDTAAIGWLLSQAINEERKTSLSELCDTYYRMPWAEFKDVLAQSGFEEVSNALVTESGRVEERIIAAHPGRKILATATSSTYEDTGPVLDYNVVLYAAANDGGDLELRDSIYQTGGSIKPIGETEYELIYYATEGLNLLLAKFDSLGIQFIEWPELSDGESSWLPVSPASGPQWVRDFTRGNTQAS